ncbi:MAG TPA: helix-turn-helix domain-containing protein [Acidimicrobiales bacterium]|nr:helix-turn-helix domain-containing protein [Acidimicrobiales bacterium]
MRASSGQRSSAAQDTEASPEGPRRSILAQERSRQTRQELVRAALRLWSERGFETGVEETTAKEIAEAAGVTKGTFYFHFAHKEHILLEMGWATAQIMYEEGERALAAGRSVDDTIDRLMTSLARRVTAAPRPAVARAVLEFNKLPAGERYIDEERHFGFRYSFATVFREAQVKGELPADIDSDELGAMLEALVMDAILRWAQGGTTPLRKSLRQRSSILLAGLRHGGVDEDLVGSGRNNRGRSAQTSVRNDR